MCVKVDPSGGQRNFRNRENLFARQGYEVRSNRENFAIFHAKVTWTMNPIRGFNEGTRTNQHKALLPRWLIL